MTVSPVAVGRVVSKAALMAVSKEKWWVVWMASAMAVSKVDLMEHQLVATKVERTV